MDGVLIIDKPAGLTSHDVVARVRGIVGARRVGHTGTLDPFATGVLVVLVGRATRLAQFLSGAEKEYQALIRLGYATDTGDATGNPVVGKVHAKTPRLESLRKADIEAAMAALTGEIEQVPPMYSAKKVRGRKLYEHARRGQEIQRQPARVNVSVFELLISDHESAQINQDETCDLRVRVVCSAGTYVRTLAEDLGKRLAIGAHLAELRRTRAGRFGIKEAITLEELAERMASASLPRVMISPADALSHLPYIELDEAQTRQTVNGIDLSVPAEVRSRMHGDAMRMISRGELIAVGKVDASSNTIHPTVVIGTG